ncbi:hypothetical protein OY671_011320, partial [Metschnikowia pulcherrima]
PGTAARQAGTRRSYDFERNDWIEVPTYERQALDAEQTSSGPASVVEDETTTFVPAGFEARRSRLGSSQRIRFQSAWNRSSSVVEEQAQVSIRSAFGTATREAGDSSAGVFSPDGRMIAQAVTGTPGHVNAMAESVKH